MKPSRVMGAPIALMAYRITKQLRMLRATTLTLADIKEQDALRGELLLRLEDAESVGTELLAWAYPDYLAALTQSSC